MAQFVILKTNVIFGGPYENIERCHLNYQIVGFKIMEWKILLNGNKLEQRKPEPSVGIGWNESTNRPTLASIIRVLLGWHFSVPRLLEQIWTILDW